MNAWCLVGSDESRRLERQSRPDTGPAENEVVVQVKAIALNHRDLLMLKGRVGQPVPTGRIPCSDAAGEVVETGPAVRTFKRGDRVITTFAPAWLAGSYSPAAAASVLGGVANDGVLADRLVLAEGALVAMPDALSFEEASTLPCAALTAWHALFEESSLPEEATVLTMGSGGVSVFALQFARRAGRRVVAVSRQAAKLERLRGLGAYATIDASSTPNWGERVRDMSDGGVTHVIDVGGQGTLSQSIRATRHGGTISLIGTLARPTPVDLTPVLMRNIRIQGIVAGSRDMLQRMNATLVDGSLRPVVDRVFPFSEAPAAFDYLSRGAHVGKVVVEVGQS